MKRTIALFIAGILLVQQSVCWAETPVNLDELKDRFISDMTTGRLNLLPSEYCRIFRSSYKNIGNIPDMIFSVREAKWVQLKKDTKVNIMAYNKKEGKPESQSIILKKGSWVLKNGANILLMQDLLTSNAVVSQQTWEWWRTDAFKQVVTGVGYTAIALALGNLASNAFSKSEGDTNNYVTNNVVSSGTGGSGGSTLPEDGPGPDPSN